MCRRTTCKQCGKPSWAGCGAHVEAVLGDVPAAQRCRCGEMPASKPSRAAAATPPEGALSKFAAWLKK